jgi:hypothetical protein
MDGCYDHSHELRALAMRVAALEDNVAYLERWCEEQQDTLDRAAGPIPYDYEREPDLRTMLRVVDLRDEPEPGDDDFEPAGIDTVVAVVETEHDRRVRQIQAKLNRLRTRLALSVAPPAEAPPAPRPGARRLSAKQAGRTAP